MKFSGFIYHIKLSAMKKILVATIKPFASAAIQEIQKIAEPAGYELERLEKYSDKSELLNAVTDAEGMIVRSDKVDEEVLTAGKDLKIVVRAGAGYDNVDLDAATKHDVCVMNTPGQNSNAVAELAFGLMIMSARKNYQGTSGIELKGKTIGFHGAGNVAKEMARIAKGFGMNILIWNHRNLKAKAKYIGGKPASTLEDLYSKCHFISINIPYSKNTHKCIGSDLLSKMQQDAILVNTARKELICEDDLLKIMEERPDIRYVADIAPDCSDQFKERFEGRYIFTTKKMGAQTAEANINAGKAAAQQIIDFLEKGIDTFRVNR